MDAEIDAPSAIREITTHTGLTLKSRLLIEIFLSGEKSVFSIYAAPAALHRCHSSLLLLAQYDHRCPPLAAEQPGRLSALRACTSAVLFKQRESVTHSCACAGIQPSALIDFIAFAAPQSLQPWEATRGKGSRLKWAPSLRQWEESRRRFLSSVLNIGTVFIWGEGQGRTGCRLRAHRAAG